MFYKYNIYMTNVIHIFISHDSVRDNTSYECDQARQPSLCYIMTGPGTMKIVTDIKTD